MPKRKLQGGEMPQEKTFFKSARESYSDAPKSELDGFQLVKSTPTLKVYKKDNTLLVGVRGTKVSDKKDLVADAKLAVNALKSSDRYKKDKATFDEIVRQFPPQNFEYYLSGHSLGGGIANQLKYDFPFIRDSVQYNPAFQPKDFIWAQGPTTKRIYTDKDGLYQLGGRFFRNKKVIPASSSTGYSAIDAISGHVLSNFASLYGEPTGGSGGAELLKHFEEVRGNALDAIPDYIKEEVSSIEKKKPSFKVGVSSILSSIENRNFQMALSYFVYLLKTKSEKQITDAFIKLLKGKATGGRTVPQRDPNQFELTSEMLQTLDFLYQDLEEHFMGERIGISRDEIAEAQQLPSSPADLFGLLRTALERDDETQILMILYRLYDNYSFQEILDTLAGFTGSGGARPHKRLRTKLGVRTIRRGPSFPLGTIERMVHPANIEVQLPTDAQANRFVVTPAIESTLESIWETIENHYDGTQPSIPEEFIEQAEALPRNTIYTRMIDGFRNGNLTDVMLALIPLYLDGESVENIGDTLEGSPIAGSGYSPLTKGVMRRNAIDTRRKRLRDLWDEIRSKRATYQVTPTQSLQDELTLLEDEYSKLYAEDKKLAPKGKGFSPLAKEVMTKQAREARNKEFEDVFRRLHQLRVQVRKNPELKDEFDATLKKFNELIDAERRLSPTGKGFSPLAKRIMTKNMREHRKAYLRALQDEIDMAQDEYQANPNVELANFLNELETEYAIVLNEDIRLRTKGKGATGSGINDSFDRMDGGKFGEFRQKFEAEPNRELRKDLLKEFVNDVLIPKFRFVEAVYYILKKNGLNPAEMTRDKLIDGIYEDIDEDPDIFLKAIINIYRDIQLVRYDIGFPKHLKVEDVHKIVGKGGSRSAGFIKMLYAKRVLGKKPEDYPTRDKKAPLSFRVRKIAKPSKQLAQKFGAEIPVEPEKPFNPNRPFTAAERKALTPSQLEQVRQLERERQWKSKAKKEGVTLEEYKRTHKLKGVKKGAGVIDELGKLAIKGVKKLGKMLLESGKKPKKAKGGKLGPLQKGLLATGALAVPAFGLMTSAILSKKLTGKGVPRGKGKKSYLEQALIHKKVAEGQTDTLRKQRDEALARGDMERYHYLDTFIQRTAKPNIEKIKEDIFEKVHKGSGQVLSRKKKETQSVTIPTTENPLVTTRKRSTTTKPKKTKVSLANLKKEDKVLDRV